MSEGGKAVIPLDIDKMSSYELKIGLVLALIEKKKKHGSCPPYIQEHINQLLKEIETEHH